MNSKLGKRRRVKSITPAKQHDVPRQTKKPTLFDHFSEKGPPPRIVPYFAVIIAATALVFGYLNFAKPTGRAQLGATSARLASPLLLGHQIDVVVDTENTGTEPAKDVATKINSIITMPFSEADIKRQNEDGPPKPPLADDPCIGVEPQAGGPIIYAKASKNLSAIAPPAFWADDALMSAKRPFSVRGCIAYHSNGSTQKSSYCYYLGLRIDPTTSQRQFQPCSWGHSAD